MTLKRDIHPTSHEVVFMDVNSGYRFLSRSTKTSNETVEWEDGKTYPVIKVETSSDTHPFYTGRQKFGEKKAEEPSSLRKKIKCNQKKARLITVCFF
ncbi:hypothetical protein BsIDN1_53790 [Bacillus safensis]|uniref:50S ribosomal protein L31 type B n=1 Tax=Bacillus safensis TaxID=561879 RepID=A0A5S9MFM7_BACIA|nr:hypothetical protein BsIDN1_53790 [Bacillus safensis]